MSQPIIWEGLGGVSEAYIMDAMPPSWQASASGATPPPRKRTRVAEFFLDNGWVAAVLSAVVAVAVIVAIVLAGRGEPIVPPVESLPESDTERATESETETEAAYTLEYTPLGDGTCSVRIVGNPSVDRDYEVVIPETSPEGDVVAEVAERQFDLLVPRIMTVEFYEEEIPAPLEAYYGLTLEEAEANRANKDHPLYEEGFYLRKHLSYFMHYDETDPYWPIILEAYPELSHGDFYTLEATISSIERILLGAELARADISPATILSCYDEVDEICGYAAGTAAARYAPSAHETLSSGRHIRSVTLPDTIKIVSDQAFLGCVNLRNIDLGDGVEILGSGALGECNRLSELRVPTTLREIRNAYIEEYDMFARIHPATVFSLYVPDATTLWRCDWSNLIELQPKDVELNIYVNDLPLTDLTIPADATHIYINSTLDESLPPPDGIHVIHWGIFCYVPTAGITLNAIDIPSGVVYCEKPPFSSYQFLRYPGTLSEWEAVQKVGWDGWYTVECADGLYESRDS